MLFVNDSTHDLQLAYKYFHTNFGLDPALFSGFLLFFRNYLKNVKNKDSKYQLAFKSFVLISPLCEKFNVSKEGQLLDDLCFKILYPEDYRMINASLQKYKKDSQKYIDIVIDHLNKVLSDSISDFDIIGRYKSIYSIFQKMNRSDRKRHIFTIRDIFAFRIILKSNSIGQCYQVADLLRGHFVEDPQFYKDYITKPKSSGYQSIHIILNNIIPLLSMPVEIQIRTKSMNNYAKHGLCAHWLYKQQINSDFITSKEKMILRHEISILEVEKYNSADTYCLNERGNIIVLKSNNTVLDFAYKLGPSIGNKIVSAYVNGKKRALDHTLQSGDLVKIVYGKKDQVHSDWLKFVYKRKSRQLISDYLSNKRKIYFGMSD